ncbi:MAG: type II toxin-antitoxin system HipA family toxin [Bacteroidota bacterium]
MGAVRIKIWGHTLGAVAWDSLHNYGVIEFSEDFIRLGLDLAPLTMPLEDLARGQRIFAFPGLNTRTYEGLPGLLSDALPDAFGNAVLQGWLRSQNRGSESLTPMEKLSYMGKRAMGALEFEPAIETPEPEEKMEVERLLKLTNKVLEEKNKISLDLKADEERAMASLIRIGASAGGQRPKALIGYHPDTKELRSGQVPLPRGFRYYLLKFDGVQKGTLGDPAGYGRLELAYYHMALECGITMQPCEILEENGRAHFMTLRFDRTDEGEKLHIQTLCGMSHFDYNQAGVYAYEDAFEEMRALSLPYPDHEQLYRRMAFNVVARNQDDHTKNISFLMPEKGEWRLAPAYDLTWNYNSQGDWTNMHQMSINQKRDDFTTKDLLEVAHRQGIKNPKTIIRQTVDVLSRWPSFAEETGVAKNLTEAAGKTHRLHL